MALDAYRNRFDQFSEQFAPAEQALRRNHLDRFLAEGFPTPRLEAWRFTNLSWMADRNFELANAANPPAEADTDFIAGADRLLYVNGRFSGGSPHAVHLHGPATGASDSADPDALSALNAAFDSGGLRLVLGNNECRDRPLHVLMFSAGGGGAQMVHQRHRIELGESADAIVILEFCGSGSGDGLSTQVIDIKLKADSRLDLYRVCRGASEATLLSRIDVSLERGAGLSAITIDSGSGLTRHDFNVRLIGPGAQVNLSGLYMPEVGGHIDNQTRIVHAATHGTSRERYRGIVGERSRAIFNGRIEVRPGAQKTDSEQRIANLLLSDRAQVNAKPEFEIYASDVKCAHGATVGQLDPKALDYLKLRGIDEAPARQLLLRAFASEILESIEFDDLRERLETSLGFAPDDLVAPLGEIGEIP